MTDRLARSPSAGSDDKGLFSLVEAATIARPIPTPRDSSVDSAFSPGSYNGPSSLAAGGGSSFGGTSKAHAAMKHRRLSSTGQARRRLSDAREATSRPSPVMLQTAAAALSSLATLSLSGSPPPQGAPQNAPSFTTATGQMVSGPSAKVPKQETNDDGALPDEASAVPPKKTEINAAGISVTKTGKKRGTIFKCESCSKVYRHPSCLIKHRWEHSPHWREASKFLLSKHQQVQLLEAAAILSHLDPSATGGRSLPEDRSLWPSFLSGGLLPPPDTANSAQASTKSTPKARSSSVSTSLDQPTVYPTSSSFPATSLLSSNAGATAGRGPTRSPSAGPRMYDYALPNSGGITHVRPGVVGVPVTVMAQSDVPSGHPAPISEVGAMAQQRSAPMPVPAASRDAYRDGRDGGYSFVSTSAASASEAWSSPVSVSFAQSSFRSSSVTSHSAASNLERSFSFSSEGAGAGAGSWSLPRSSVRSSSLSRSRSGSGDEADYIDVDVDGVPEDYEGVAAGRFGFTSRGWKMDMARRGNGKIDEEEWDGKEMEMEM